MPISLFFGVRKKRRNKKTYPFVLPPQVGQKAHKFVSVWGSVKTTVFSLLGNLGDKCVFRHFESEKRSTSEVPKVTQPSLYL